MYFCFRCAAAAILSVAVAESVWQWPSWCGGSTCCLYIQSLGPQEANLSDVWQWCYWCGGRLQSVAVGLCHVVAAA